MELLLFCSSLILIKLLPSFCHICHINNVHYATKTGESKANQFSLVAKSTLESLLSGEQFFRFGDYLSKGSCLVIEVSLNLFDSKLHDYM